MSEFLERIKRLSSQQKLLLAKHIGGEKNMKISGENNSNQSIAAYFVSVELIGANELRNSLKDKLPEYMMPSKFVQLDELPRLPNGKIDVNSLRLPVEKDSSISKAGLSVAPTETELQLVAIWEEVLGFHPISVHDNFFEVGGDSILSIQIVAKARQKGIFLAPNQLFQHQTINDLAQFAKKEDKNIVEEEAVVNVSLDETNDYSPSDFPEADLNQNDLDNLLNQIK